jgi:hypothetical protein
MLDRFFASSHSKSIVTPHVVTLQVTSISPLVGALLRILGDGCHNPDAFLRDVPFRHQMLSANRSIRPLNGGA